MENWDEYEKLVMEYANLNGQLEIAQAIRQSKRVRLSVLSMVTCAKWNVNANAAG